jgi:hypothetical protein
VASSFLRLVSLSAIAGVLLAVPAYADKIKNPTAVFSGLDKITGRIVSFEVQVDETVQFGSLQLTPRVCYSRPATEAPKTTSFIEVGEVDAANQLTDIFDGWVFAASPGLSAIDHPVYDVWLTACKGGTEVIKTPDEDDEPQLVSAPKEEEPASKPKAARKKIVPKEKPKQKIFPAEANTGGDAGAPISLTPTN